MCSSDLEELALSTDFQETVAALNDFSKLQQSGNAPHITLPVSNERPLPSILQAPIPDLKPSPVTTSTCSLEMKERY